VPPPLGSKEDCEVNQGGGRGNPTKVIGWHPGGRAVLLVA